MNDMPMIRTSIILICLVIWSSVNAEEFYVSSAAGYGTPIYISSVAGYGTPMYVDIKQRDCGNPSTGTYIYLSSVVGYGEPVYISSVAGYGTPVYITSNPNFSEHSICVPSYTEDRDIERYVAAAFSIIINRQ